MYTVVFMIGWCMLLAVIYNINNSHVFCAATVGYFKGEYFTWPSYINS
jgi:hypothetical protein